MAKDMLEAVYQAEEECKQRETNAKAKSAQRIEQAKAEAAQAVLLAKENAQKSAEVLFEKTMGENRQELKSACEKADFDCEILSQTADKNRSRVIDGAIKILAL